MSSATSAGPQVPAWKRLGLKLKYASEVSQTPVKISATSAAPSSTEKSKRKRGVEAKDLARVKKSRKIPGAVAKTSNSTPTTPQLRRQKSVTFTPETKAQDGDSIKQLFAAWSLEQKANDPSFSTNAKSQSALREPTAPIVEEQVDSTPGLTESEKRVKRVKKSNPARATPKPDRSAKKKTSLDPALAYLDQFCHSRESWKFNKIHQINLLKNAFEFDLIPSAAIEQLYIYISGLKGQARRTLRDTALAIKVKDQEEGEKGFPSDMADTSKRQREYDAAVNEYVATLTAANAHPAMGYEEGVLLGLSDFAMKPRMAKRMRVERILADLAKSGDGNEIELPKAAGSTDREAEKDSKAGDGKAVRKRKQRTTEMIEDSSSSSSEDSSSSDDDGSDVETEQSESSTPSGSTSSSSSSSSDSE